MVGTKIVKFRDAPNWKLNKLKDGKELPEAEWNYRATWLFSVGLSLQERLCTSHIVIWSIFRLLIFNQALIKAIMETWLEACITSISLRLKDICQTDA